MPTQNIPEIYVDNAATTKISPAALRALITCNETTFGNPSSLHSSGQAAAEALGEARGSIASHLGCDPRQLYFNSGGSESDNHAILSAAASGAKKDHRHIISTTIEHHAVLHTLKKLEREGFEITLLEVGKTGRVTPEQVENALRPDTCLVTIMCVNNEIGTIQPIPEIGAVCKKHPTLFHTDAVQAAGVLPLNVDDLGVDLLSLSAHKFHGPKGTGVLYARKGVRLISLIEGGAQERGKRAGTEDTPAIVAMATAFEEATSGRAKNVAYLTFLRDRLITGLARIPHAALNGDSLHRSPSNVSFCFEGIEGESLLLLLDAKGIRASSGSACTSGSLDPSHVLLAIGRPHEVAHGSLRLSLSTDNTEKEIDFIIESVGEVVSYLRSISPLWRDLVEGKKQHVI